MSLKLTQQSITGYKITLFLNSYIKLSFKKKNKKNWIEKVFDCY